MKLLSLVLTLVVLSGGPTLSLFAQATPDQETVVRGLEEVERRAVLESDIAKLQELWAPEMIVNNPQNRISPDREAVLAGVRNGVIKYTGFERRIEAIRLHGDLAIVMGSETVTAAGNNPKAGQQVHRRFTNIWRKVGGSWRIIARHANSLPEPR